MVQSVGEKKGGEKTRERGRGRKGKGERKRDRERGGTRGKREEIKRGRGWGRDSETTIDIRHIVIES